MEVPRELRVSHAIDCLSQAPSPEVTYRAVKIALFLIKFNREVRMEPMMNRTQFYAQIEEEFLLLPFDVFGSEITTHFMVKTIAIIWIT